MSARLGNARPDPETRPGSDQPHTEIRRRWRQGEGSPTTAEPVQMRTNIETMTPPPFSTRSAILKLSGVSRATLPTGIQLKSTTE